MPIVEDLIEAIHNGLSTSEDSISIHAVMDIAREKEKTVISPDKSLVFIGSASAESDQKRKKAEAEALSIR
jgi:hypothetical protein